MSSNFGFALRCLYFFINNLEVEVFCINYVNVNILITYYQLHRIYILNHVTFAATYKPYVTLGGVVKA